MTTVKLISSATVATGTAILTPKSGNPTPFRPGLTFQASLVGTAAVTATCVVAFSNDNSNWLTGGTITLSGTTTASDGFASSANWEYVRGSVTAIGGTAAVATVWMSF